MEYYLQEVAGADLLQSLSPTALDRIGLLAAASEHLVNNVLLTGAGLQQRPGHTQFLRLGVAAAVPPPRPPDR